MAANTTDAPKVAYSEYSKAIAELTDAFESEFGPELARRIQFYEASRSWDDVKKMGVNWSAVGTVDAEEAARFASALAAAAGMAAGFKYNGYAVEY